MILLDKQLYITSPKLSYIFSAADKLKYKNEPLFITMKYLQMTMCEVSSFNYFYSVGWILCHALFCFQGSDYENNRPSYTDELVSHVAKSLYTGEVQGMLLNDP